MTKKVYEHLDTLDVGDPDRPMPLGGCPTDKELEEMRLAAEREQIERNSTEDS